MFDDGIERALSVALHAHEGQVRKCEDRVPYVVHPLHVALMLAQCGADPEVIQAGLLHDVVEDSPLWTMDRLEREFGARVRSVVEELSEDKALSWEQRKRQGVDSVAEMSPDAVLVKACDKLHNLRSLANALSRAPDPSLVWQRFKGGRERTLILSEELVAALSRRAGPTLAGALTTAMQEVRRR